ncbi:metal-dependent hydrolase [Paenibacillus turpanensis]|uniref:metal-dependent hydrolase n=1 Tax=Paenibacillus turpanensis TaxID=2689078 RepID=UPI00140740A5|nr:metal-dependent hydrolase [Paenibacillus turpanensis]
MDTITHTLFGLTIYGAFKKPDMTVREKRALLFTAVAGSQIPDIDVISAWWDSAGRYQMWHRGITHSVFLVPVWAAFLAQAAKIIFKLPSLMPLFSIALLAVFIHDTSDIFNAWGTGYFEPVSTTRLTFGTIPIVDLVFWAIMAAGFLFVRYGRSRLPSYKVYRIVGLLLALHVAIQTAQGAVILNQAEGKYEQAELSAEFIPGMFTLVGKQGNEVTISRGSAWTGLKTVETLTSQEQADLERLFRENPRAKTLYEWAPFVVVVADEQRIGIYDPRFIRNGESFLAEYIELVKSVEK